MATKIFICIAVLIAAIEAYPRYVAVPIEEYQALKYQEPNVIPLVRHKRSTFQDRPSRQTTYLHSFEPKRQYSPQQAAPSIRREIYVQPRQQYAQGSEYNYKPQQQQYEPSVRREIYVQPEQQYPHRSEYNYKPQQQQYEPSVQSNIFVQPEQEYAPTPQYSYKPQQQQYESSVQNEILLKPQQIHPFTGEYDGTPQGQLVYVEGPEPMHDLAQGASQTHEKRDAHHGGGGGGGGGGNDHVDYGAYTGSHGAFGWYSDHPVSLHHRR